MAKKVVRRVEVEEEVEVATPAVTTDTGEALASALLILTTLCLLAAIIIAWSQLGRDYNVGLFAG